jgi:hypothetical protein
MSRSFISANSEYLQVGSAVLTGVPLTMACWFRSTDITIAQELMVIANSASAVTLNNFRLVINGNQFGDRLRAFTSGATANPAAVTSTGYSANTWHHAAGVWAAVNSRAAYIDGGSKGTESTSETPSGLNRTVVGALRQGSNQNFMSGRIALPCIWNVALSDNEVAQLAAGFHPSLIRPDAIAALWELDQGASPEPDAWGSFPLTLGGSPIYADDPPIIYPSGAVNVIQAAAAPPTGNRRRRVLLCGGSR